MGRVGRGASVGSTTMGGLQSARRARSAACGVPSPQCGVPATVRGAGFPATVRCCAVWAVCGCGLMRPAALRASAVGVPLRFAHVIAGVLAATCVGPWRLDSRNVRRTELTR